MADGLPGLWELWRQRCGPVEFLSLHWDATLTADIVMSVLEMVPAGSLRVRALDELIPARLAVPAETRCYVRVLSSDERG
jgi:hypothetical protein